MKFLVLAPVALVPFHSAEICSAFGLAAALNAFKRNEVVKRRAPRALRCVILGPGMAEEEEVGGGDAAQGLLWGSPPDGPDLKLALPPTIRFCHTRAVALLTLPNSSSFLVILSRTLDLATYIPSESYSNSCVYSPLMAGQPEAQTARRLTRNGIKLELECSDTSADSEPNALICIVSTE